MKRYLNSLARARLLCACVVLLGVAAALLAPLHAGAQAAQEPRVFVPMVAGAGAPAGQPGQPGKPAAESGAFFFNRQVKNNSAAVQMDAAGGMHAAYGAFTPDAEHPPAVYTFCPGPAAACADPTAWRAVELADLVEEVQLALTPEGRPRLLITATSTVLSGGLDYFYAACDAGCGERSAWSVTRLTSTHGTSVQNISDQRQPQRSFALDPQGRPRFVYQDRNYFYAEPDHIGAFYAWCDDGCADANNWYETKIGREISTQWRRDNEIFEYPSLTFTATGQPRVTARIFGFNEDGSEQPEGLYYLGCDADCGERQSWGRVFLIPTGSGSYPHPSWDLALASGDRPRIALFTGGGLQPDDLNTRLLYLWCESACLDQSSWQFNRVGLASGSGQSPDLELDVQDRPRLAWVASGGDLGYAWCDTACEQDPAPWQQRVVETEATLRAEFPQAIPPHCDTDTWEGLAPVLALDAAGNPRIAYDVSVEARCYYDTTPGDPTDPPSVKFEPVWRGVHLAFFRQP